MMKKTIAARNNCAHTCSAGFALAQQTTQPSSTREDRGFRPSTEDVAALTDARVAGLKAGLKLTAEQEENWPVVKPRSAISPRIAATASRSVLPAARRAAGGDNAQQAGRMRSRGLRQGADAMTARAASLKKLAGRVGAALQKLDRRPETPLCHAAPAWWPARTAGASLAAPRRQTPR